MSLNTKWQAPGVVRLGLLFNTVHCSIALTNLTVSTIVQQPCKKSGGQHTDHEVQVVPMTAFQCLVYTCYSLWASCYFISQALLLSKFVEKLGEAWVQGTLLMLLTANTYIVVLIYSRPYTNICFIKHLYLQWRGPHHQLPLSSPQIHHTPFADL